MMIVRPCAASDLTGIEEVLNDSANRVSSLPRDRDKLDERIHDSVRSFAQEPDIAGREAFLFVLENTDKGEIAGVSGIKVNRDSRLPFYNYRLDELIHSSPRLDVQTKVPVLYLTHELTGKTVLSSYAIKESYLNDENFNLLSRARLLFISEFREHFSDELVVEIQGVLDENEDSPFWESLGRHFFNMDFATADYYAGIKSRTLLAEMMPAHPIYVSLLSDEAQRVMGKSDSRAAKTCQLLFKEGFKNSRYVDIFDGGPTLIAKVDDLVSVKQAQCKEVIRSEMNTGLRYITCNQSFESFRCGFSQLTDGLGSVLRIDERVAEHLQLENGDSIRFVSL